MGSLAYLPVGERPFAVDVQALANRMVRLDISEPSRVLACVVYRSSLYDHIKELQYDDPHFLVLKDRVQHDDARDVIIDGDGVLRMRGRICVPNVDGLRELILEEAHSSRYSIYPGAAKMYQDLRYERSGAQIGTTGFPSGSNYVRVFAETCSFEVPDSPQSWEFVNQGSSVYVMVYAEEEDSSRANRRKMAPYEALYKWKCRSPIGWFDVGKTTLVGPKLVQQAIEKIKFIQERLLAAQGRQKSYADNRQRDLEFQVDNWVFLKVSPMKGVIRDPSRIMSVDDVQVTKQLSYEETPIVILDRQVRRLRTKDIASVKVLWRNNNVEEITWEAEEDIKSIYPYLFPPPEKGPTETSQP
ncbi:uncharacterized protein [Nicotiana sylvestris]|uniref:uncharacterized protein n=1 Tax=Nicotiana sylvestris TaxID=4096 RepID=UPI00388C6DE3